MALKPRAVPVTREHVYEWLQEYEGQQRSTKKMREFIEGKLEEMGLDPTTKIETPEHENLPDEMDLVDMILLDIESYGNND
jgi:hypothetical protein